VAISEQHRGQIIIIACVEPMACTERMLARNKSIHYSSCVELVGGPVQGLLQFRASMRNHMKTPGDCKLESPTRDSVEEKRLRVASRGVGRAGSAESVFLDSSNQGKIYCIFGRGGGGGGGCGVGGGVGVGGSGWGVKKGCGGGGGGGCGGGEVTGWGGNMMGKFT